MKERMKIGFRTWCLALGLLLGGLGATAAESIGSVSYWDSNSGTMRQSDAERTCLLASDATTLADGWWYVVEGEVTIDHPVALNGTSRIILKDGAKLTVTSTSSGEPGICVRYGYSWNDALYVYGQDLGTGELVATGGTNAPGIGGRLPHGDDSGAAIHGGNLYVYGGRVTANGGKFAAGIGGAYNATGASGTHGGDLYVYGGHLFATAGMYAAGIGGAYRAPAPDHDLQLYAGEVKAAGGEGAKSIGAGANATDTDLAGVNPHSDYWVLMSGDTDYHQDYQQSIREFDPTELRRRFLHVIAGIPLLDHPGDLTHDQWYIMDDWNKEVDMSKPYELTFTGLTVVGSANLFLGRDTLIATGGNQKQPGIRVEPNNVLNIDGYAGSLIAEAGGKGSITNTFASYCACIGGGASKGCGIINIYGGNIDAKGKGSVTEAAAITQGGAGIGGGNEGTKGTVNIYGGYVSAVGGGGAAGIGGGDKGWIDAVNIYGGDVNGYGGGSHTQYGGPGIGNGDSVTIYGGSVRAAGKYRAAGIGGGYNASGAISRFTAAACRQVAGVAHPASGLAKMPSVRRTFRFSTAISRRLRFRNQACPQSATNTVSVDAWRSSTVR